MADGNVKSIDSTKLNLKLNIENDNEKKNNDNNLQNVSDFDNTNYNINYESINIDEELLNIKNNIIDKLNNSNITDYYKKNENSTNIHGIKKETTYDEFDPISFNEYLANKK